MWQKLLRESSFFLILLSFDRDSAGEARVRGCPFCGSTLHAARYWRKPRWHRTNRVWRLKHPHDPSAVAEEVINCHCDVDYVARVAPAAKGRGLP